MAKTLRKSFHQHRWGYTIGCLATMVGCVLFMSGSFYRLNHFGLDQHFRHFSTIAADSRIVLIDINDHAITTHSDWPWPRRRFAQIIHLLNELDAQSITLDLIFSEPAGPRVQHAHLGKHYDVDTELNVMGEAANDRLIYDDDELRDAIESAGNVFLPMYARLASPTINPSTLFNQALSIVRDQKNISWVDFRNALTQAPPWTPESLYNLTRLVVILEQDYSLDLSTIQSKRLLENTLSISKIESSAVENAFALAKKMVAHRKATKILAQRPDITWKQFFESVLPYDSFDVLTADRETLLNAYRTIQAIRTIEQSCAALDESMQTRLAHTFDWTVPLDKLANVTHGIGLVAFDRESGDGVLRSVPLIVNFHEKLMPQLGFAVACDAMGIDPQSLHIVNDQLVVQTDSGSLNLPLDDSGSTLLNWHSAPGRKWEESFTHLPISRLLEVIENRQAFKDNQQRLGIVIAELVKLRHKETPSQYAQYEKLIQTKHAQPQPTDRNQIEANLTRMEEDAVIWLQRVWQLWQKETPANDQERLAKEKIVQLYDTIIAGKFAEHLTQLNEQLQNRNKTLLIDLRSKIENKICLVGYTASAVADLISTPVYSSMPGVMAHANIINMILQQKPARLAPMWMNLLLVVLTCMVITDIACQRSPVISAIGMLTLVAVVILAGGFTFQYLTLHLATMPASVVIALVWTMVTVQRQLTQEKSKQRFEHALSQYTSSAVATRIAEQSALQDMAPVAAQVSCFFSDLQGFTHISEKLGAARTRSILNPYLETMTRVLNENGALVNKFIGDGIFAFFNSPIWPCEEHAEAACASALEAVKAIHKINEQPIEDTRLVMRIGLSTGDVFVGDYGSDAKLDYTCIGDTVNLAARLEKANKAFGTSILIDAPTHHQVSDRFAFRSLGKIMVAGRSQPAEVYELVGDRSDLDADHIDYIARFEKMIHHFQSGEWDTCQALLQQCQSIEPNDLAISLFMQTVVEMRESTTSTAFHGALIIP